MSRCQQQQWYNKNKRTMKNILPAGTALNTEEVP